LPVVLTVRVEVPLDNALKEQVGAGLPPPVMLLQLRATPLALKPFVPVTVMVEVAEPPGDTDAGESAVAAKVKPGVELLTVSVTWAVWLVFPDVPLTVTVEVPLWVVEVVLMVKVSAVPELVGVTGLAGANEH
jgi:hypothetical protein